MTAFLAAIGLRERYVGRHRSGETADWTPAHTRTAARRRARLEHVRPDGERPDRRIEQTVPLDLARLNEIVAGGTR